MDIIPPANEAAGERRQDVIDTPNEVPIERLAGDIVTLSALIQAATYRLLVLIGELDRRKGWCEPLESGGFRSCAHWISWHLSLGLVAARQYVRVARALPELPEIAAAFSRGELSYSKVRALVRIANGDNEPLLLQWARAGTAAQVEQLVRRYRSADRRKENEQALAQQETRGLKAYFDDDGMLVLRGRLAPEQGALLLKALEVSREALFASGGTAESPSGGTAESPSGGTAESSSGATAESSSGATAESPAGRGRETHSDSGQVTGGQLLVDALARVAERALAADSAEASPASADRFVVVVHVDAEVLSDPHADGRCELEDGPRLAADTARRLACDAPVVVLTQGKDGAIVPGRKRRFVTAPLRRALQARDGTGCAFPGCGCRGRDAHHVQHWAAGGLTRLPNMLNLCRLHHRLVHEGGYRVAVLPGGTFRFIDPGGRELPAAPPTPVVSDEPANTLAQQWLPADLDIDADTGRPGWPDDPFDDDWAVESLQLRAAQGDR